MFQYIANIYATSNVLDCGCDKQGSTSLSCDENTKNKICSCKPNVIGDKCTACKSGFYGFPNCQGTIYFMYIIFHNRYFYITRL